KSPEIHNLEIDFSQFENRNVSRREFEVLSLLVKGLSYDQIADRLFISHSTVTKHVHSIYKKLEVKNRVNLYDVISGKELEHIRN
ncbi:MAG: helix-turn-helix transcriptional regulator, partial [Spirochaetales bacterium]|nr:helix-turn-helix transcriptional regulator [Spirochaetales bacterium]